MLNRLSYCLLFFLPILYYAQENSSLQFIEYKGQYSDHVLYKLPLNSGDAYFENNKVTYNLYDKGKISSLKHGLSKDDFLIQGHAYQTIFISAKIPSLSGLDTCSNYYNFFLGNDSTKWASKVKAFNKIYYNEI